MGVPCDLMGFSHFKNTCMLKPTDHQAIHDKMFSILKGAEQNEQSRAPSNVPFVQHADAEVERAQKFKKFAIEFGVPQPATQLIQTIIDFYSLNSANDPSKRSLAETAQQAYGHKLLQALALPWRNDKPEPVAQALPARPAVRPNTMTWLTQTLGVGQTPKGKLKNPMRLG